MLSKMQTCIHPNGAALWITFLLALMHLSCSFKLTKQASQHHNKTASISMLLKGK